jgi:hypothetical protein
VASPDTRDARGQCRIRTGADLLSLRVQGRRQLRGRVLPGDQGRVPAVRRQVDAAAQALLADQPALLEGRSRVPDEEGRAGDDQAGRQDLGRLPGEVARSAVVTRRRVVQQG